MSKNIVVIGGGSAGIESAKSARRAGANVTLVSNAPIGGRAGWHSLLPSKVWLTAADTIGLAQQSNELGLEGGNEVSFDPSAILERLRQVKSKWHDHQQKTLVETGVEIVRGTAVFTAPDSIKIHNDQGTTIGLFSADAFIVCTGSVPVFPPEMKPNGQRIIAPRFASALNSLPSTMIVVGGGATGSEFAYLFNRLGVDVTWIIDEQGILPDFDLEAGEFLGERLKQRGVTLVKGQRAKEILDDGHRVTVTLVNDKAYEAEQAFLAIGRKPDVTSVQLEGAGLKVKDGMVAADAYGRTPNPLIYLAGDVSGKPMMANRAMAQAWVTGQAAAGVDLPPFNPAFSIAAIYTEPQVAQVGQMQGEGLQAVRLSYMAGLKAHLVPDGDGFVKLAYEGDNGRLCGAVAVGHHAADILAPVAVALQNEMSVQQLGMMYAAHPTLSELAFMAARQVT